MSAVKAFLEDVSMEMGFGGEITEEVLATQGKLLSELVSVLSRAPQKKCVVFCRSLSDVRNLASDLQRAGVACRGLTCLSPEGEIEGAVQDFQTGKLYCLVSGRVLLDRPGPSGVDFAVVTYKMAEEDWERVWRLTDYCVSRY